MNTKELLFKKLEELSIPMQTVTHEPIFTCSESAKIKAELPAHAFIKNLFLKDNKKRFWLVSALHSTEINLKKLSKVLPAPNLRFTNPDELLKHLGVLPGSVTPLALINDREHAVHVILDAEIFEHKIIGVHPLSNDATTLLTPQDLQKFIEACGNDLKVMDFKTVAAP